MILSSFLNIKAKLGFFVLAVAMTVSFSASTQAQSLPSFDFTQSSVTQDWGSVHDISKMETTTNGLVLTISGSDPYFSGPKTNFPAGQALWLRLRLKSTQGGTCQIFYFTTGASEAASVRFDVPAGRWVTGRVALPALGSNYRIRIDPPGTGGQAILSSLSFEARGNLPSFDFTTIPDATQWGNPHDLTILTQTDEGLPLSITNSDPYFYGPSRDYPTNELLWMNIRMKSDVSGFAQVFYFQTGPSEANSVHFFVQGGDWVQLRVPLPALWSQTSLRIDPPGESGVCILGNISFEARPSIQSPEWPSPEPGPIGSNSISSGDLTLVHNTSRLGAFQVQVKGTNVAVGNNRSLIGYLSGTTQRWLEVTNPVVLTQDNGSMQATTTFDDPDGAQWQWRQIFTPNTQTGGIEVESRVTVNQDRSVIFLPMFTVLPGVGTFGTNKTQAVFAGVEYLENEASSSELDVIGSGSQRQVPDFIKLTFPLMALSAESNYVGLIWEQSSQFAGLHDSPDRIFKSGGHLMSVIFPGSDPSIRQDGQVLPYGGQQLVAGQPLVMKGTLIGGTGNTIIPAVQQYVAQCGLPEIPQSGYTATDYFTLAAHGWLDTTIRSGAKFRHAIGTSFTYGACSDAAFYMDWLSSKVSDTNLSARLSETSSEARALVSTSSYNSACIGHVKYPVEALVFGSVFVNAATALSEGQGQLAVFQSDGSVLYQAPASGLDLSSNYWTKEANGLAASSVMVVLERGVFSGNQDLINKGLGVLRALSKFRNTVPRGAQTWEVPLHTPDILASAYLVRCYTLGYELTGEEDFLEQAKYWAWTGVPFVYLTQPTSQPVGVYSTIPVFGATQFVAPLWIGLPVQWCGLVYADAIRRFARHDPTGPWLHLADGIATAGVQHTHPASDSLYQGLLPDSFDLRAQYRNQVPINPATLLPEAMQMFGEPAPYDFRVLRHHGLMIHAPGPITINSETSDGASLSVSCWSANKWYVLINGFSASPSIKLNGVVTPILSPHQYDKVNGRLLLCLSAPTTIDLGTPATDALVIQRQDNASIKILWPMTATNSVLEHTTSLDSATWSQVGGTVGSDGTWYILTKDAGNSAEFFRLRKQ